MPGTGSNKSTTQFQGGGNSKCGVASRVGRGILARLLSRRANGIVPTNSDGCIKQEVFRNYNDLVDGVKNWLNNNKDCYVEINKWKITDVTDLENLFNYLSDKDLVPINTFNDDIGNWDTKNATSMAAMFSGQINFNQDIGRWNVGKVTDMCGLFNQAVKFDQDISSWDVSKVTNMCDMFRGTPGNPFANPVTFANPYYYLTNF
jgi:surface protein